MHRVLKRLAACVLLLFLAPLASCASNTPEPFLLATNNKHIGEVTKRFVHLSSPAGFGSGLLVEHGYIITNHHVLEDGKREAVRSVEATFRSGKTARAFVAGLYPKLDLAVLRVNSVFLGGIDAPAPAFGAGAVKGENIIGICTKRIGGYSKTRFIRGSILKEKAAVYFQGRVTLKNLIEFKTSHGSLKGCSGGPLVREDGIVAGIMVGSYSDGRGLAISSRTALRALEETRREHSRIQKPQPQ